MSVKEETLLIDVNEYNVSIIHSDQCPYLEDATSVIKETAETFGIQNRVVALKNCSDVRKSAPSAYGVFNVVYNKKLLSYHYLTAKELIKKLNAMES